MSKFAICFIMLFSSTSVLFSGDDNINVIGYYAVTNSLDGQPMIDKVNVLRFYPVFAMRDSTDLVSITIYYGGNIFSRRAEKLDNGRYWQTLLPIFRLGEAIQRMEIEVHFKLNHYYTTRYNAIKFLTGPTEQRIDDAQKIQGLLKNIDDSIRVESDFLAASVHNYERILGTNLNVDSLLGHNNSAYLSSLIEVSKQKIKNTLQNLSKLLKKATDDSTQLDKKSEKVLLLLSHVGDSLINMDTVVSYKKYKGDSTEIASRKSDIFNQFWALGFEGTPTEVLTEIRIDSIFLPKEIGDAYKRFQEEVIQYVREYHAKVQSFTTNRSSYQSSIAKIVNLKEEQVLDTLRIGMKLDSLKTQIAQEIEAGLEDTMYSGPSIRKSDIVIDSNFKGARILYRNYKQSLRHLVALDPAERLGIFRLRYIPFPITGIPDQPKTELRGPFNSFTVFEIGLTFGDAVVSGDDEIRPQFSWDRFGLAFGITEKLFSDSAKVIALAFTYDFNSYGSIGIGSNFAQHEVNPYASFGINKKAFEAVLSALAGLFK